MSVLVGPVEADYFIDLKHAPAAIAQMNFSNRKKKSSFKSGALFFLSPPCRQLSSART